MAKTNRRDVLRYGAAGAVTAATAVVAAQGLANADPGSGLGKSAAPADPRDFDETYKGKKIKGKKGPNGKDELRIDDKKLAVTIINTLFIPDDGAAPYVGVGYISAMNHYDPVEIDEGKHQDGLKKLARKIVDNLGTLELSDEAALEHSH
jgi:hypothetical protein